MLSFSSISFAPSFYKRSDEYGAVEAEDAIFNEMRAVNIVARQYGASQVRVYRTKGSYGPGAYPITLQFVDDNGRVVRHSTLNAVISAGLR